MTSTKQLRVKSTRDFQFAQIRKAAHGLNGYGCFRNDGGFHFEIALGNQPDCGRTYVAALQSQLGDKPHQLASLFVIQRGQITLIKPKQGKAPLRGVLS